MPSARDDILKGLRDAIAKQPPFPAQPQEQHLPVTRLAPNEDLSARFIAEVERVKGNVHPAESEDDARRVLCELLTSKGAQRATMWDQEHVRLDGVEMMLDELSIGRVQGEDDVVATADVGITGCDWAIAATGTLVLSSGSGKPRMASLLPPVHIAIVTTDQLVPRLEDYIAAQRADRLGVFRRSSNVTLITGCSRTSDIEMHPVFGVHGPLELHIILIDNLSESQATASQADDVSPFTDVWMIHRDLSQAPDFPLPPGYTFRFYHEGDAETWVRIQRACADDLSFITAAHFHADMPGDAAHLAERVLFLTDPLGNDIGTIVAWNDSKFDGRDIGRIHWVAIVAEAQGRGLSKPMMSAACNVLRALNYTEACLETHTSLIPALNLYLEFGFRPAPRSEGERAAWQAVAPRLKFAIDE